MAAAGWQGEASLQLARGAKLMETRQFNAINSPTAMGFNLRQVKLLSMQILFVSWIKIIKEFWFSWLILACWSVVEQQ